MKKLQALFYVLICITALSCMHNSHDISITYSENDHTYTMKACFNKSQTRAIEKYMDSRIGARSNMSFTNTRIDGTLALDDHTTFYMKKFPGVLEIKLDKDENSDEGYHEIKSMCRGIKRVLAK